MREAIYILPALVPRLVFGVRDEDQDPCRPVAATMEQHGDRLATLLQRSEGKTPAAFDDRTLRATLLDGSTGGALEAVLSALEAQVPPARIAGAVAMAAAERMLRFDDRIEWDDSRDETWEDAIHPLVHAVAALRALVRWPSVATLRCLFHAAARVQGTKELDLPPERRLAGVPTTRVGPDQNQALSAAGSAVRTRRPAEAMALARGYLERGHDAWRLAEVLARIAVEDGMPSNEAVDTGVLAIIAAIDTWESAGARSDQALPLLAATRYLASDSRRRFSQRHVGRELARQRRLGKPG